jgi:hypothetical protein
MKRSTRANIAVVVLAIAGFLGADLIGYGSEAGYHVAQAQGLIAGLVLFAVSLFAWNVATYKK